MSEWIIGPFWTQAFFSVVCLIISTIVVLIDDNDRLAKKMFKWSLFGLVTSPLAFIVWPLAFLTAVVVAGKRAFR